MMLRRSLPYPLNDETEMHMTSGMLAALAVRPALWSRNEAPRKPSKQPLWP